MYPSPLVSSMQRNFATLRQRYVHKKRAWDSKPKPVWRNGALADPTVYIGSVKKSVARLIASWLGGNINECVGAASRTGWPVAGGSTAQVGRDDGRGNRSAGGLVGFQRLLLNAAFYLPQIIDAGVRF